MVSRRSANVLRRRQRIRNAQDSLIALFLGFNCVHHSFPPSPPLSPGVGLTGRGTGKDFKLCRCSCSPSKTPPPQPPSPPTPIIRPQRFLQEASEIGGDEQMQNSDTTGSARVKKLPLFFLSVPSRDPPALILQPCSGSAGSIWVRLSQPGDPCALSGCRV